MNSDSVKKIFMLLCQCDKMLYLYLSGSTPAWNI